MDMKSKGSLLLGAMLLVTQIAHATVWDIQSDYSSVVNPNGAWAYGRMWTPTSNSFDVFTTRWDSSGPVSSGGIGWFMNNWGHGGPGMLDANSSYGPLVWSKNNSNGIAAIRWTAVDSGIYSLDALFSGYDGRGVDNFVYIAINDALAYSGRVTGYADTESFASNNISLDAGDNLYLSVQWAGGVYSEYGWTEVDATISTVSVPAPAMLPLFLLGMVFLSVARRPAQ